MINVKYNTFATAILWEKYKSRYPYSPGEMLQWYIRALVDPICNHIDYTMRVAFLGAVARDGLNSPIPSDYIKKYQRAFLASLPGTQKPGKKCQQLLMVRLGFVFFNPFELCH